MKTALFEFDLPQELIAQHPPERRDASRMMVLDRAKEGQTSHRLVADLPEYLRPGDLLVLNNTKVLHARLFGAKPSGGRVEVLLLEEVATGEWEALLKASRKLRVGETFSLFDGRGVAEVLETGELGKNRIRVVVQGMDLMVAMDRYGRPPLPPYIRRQAGSDASLEQDKIRYQTVFAQVPGAVAAPTAGLHFTPEIFQALENRGVDKTFVTLHTGIGTFRPVTAENLEDHVMEPERYEIPAEAAEKINAAKNRGGRVIAVGSTSVRTLETVAREHGKIVAASGRSSLYIYPPWNFRVVDAMLTNFHLPGSTLLMMVSALAGRERVLAAYAEAVAEQYRFFSYGDCMLIL